MSYLNKLSVQTKLQLSHFEVWGGREHVERCEEVFGGEQDDCEQRQERQELAEQRETDAERGSLLHLDDRNQ